ncbi:MAG: T9SS type A sorting domain-containing protein [Bacteroidota bacterium]
MPVSLAPYHFPNGDVKNNVSVLAGEFFWSGLFLAASSTYIKMLKAGMYFDFTQPEAGKIAETVTFDFLDWQGYVNLTINDNPVNVATTFSEMDTEIVDGVSMSVTEDNVGSGGKRGTVTLSGDIYSIIIGAEDFGVDNVCFTLKNAPAQTCTFSQLTASPSACLQDGSFSVTIDFTHENSSGTFTVSGNGNNYGSFNTASLPITLNSLDGDGTTNYQFTITDSQDPDCTISTNIGTVFCQQPCSFSNMTTTPLACINGNFSVLINFDHVNSSGSFNLTGNGAAYGTYSISDLPLQVGTFPGDGTTFYSFAVTDVNDSSCKVSQTLGTVSCLQPCAISNINANVQACDANGDFMVSLDFDHQNSSSSFTVSGNGNDYGTFSTNDLPINLGPLSGDGTTSYAFVVSDAQIANCSAQTTIGTISCTQPCSFTNLNASAGDCDQDGFFDVTLNFEHENASGLFTVIGDGTNYGSFNIANLPITIPGLEGDGTTNYVFTVIDNGAPSCTATTTLGSVFCEPPCLFTEFLVEESACQNGDFYVQINFNPTNTSGSFNIGGNGNSYGNYASNDLPIILGPFSGDGVTTYEFIVTDNQFEDCEAFGTIGPITCEVAPECAISDLTISNMECTSASTFSATLNFQYQGVGNAGFRLYHQEQQIGIYNYNELPLNLNNLNHGAAPMESIRVCDTNDPDCCQVIEFETMDCSSSGCLISEVLLNRRACEGGQFMVDLDLSIQSGGLLGFQVLGNGNNYGTYSYDDLPLSLGPFDGNGLSQYDFFVIDMLDPTCQNVGEIEAYNCIEECSITNLNSNIGSCDDQGETFALLSFDSDNTSTDYAIFINGSIQANHNYSAGAITIGPLPGDGTTIYQITVVDNDQNACNASIDIGPIECEQTTSTTELSESEVRFYTSRDTELLYLEIASGMGNGQMAVYNTVGQNMMNDQLVRGQGQYQYDLSQLSSGVYFCQVLIDGKMKTWKFSRF